jgi:hypothetical protein
VTPMADHTPAAPDASEKLSWKLFFILIAGAAGFIGAAFVLAM